jgi:hypothetical protein
MDLYQVTTLCKKNHLSWERTIPIPAEDMCDASTKALSNNAIEVLNVELIQPQMSMMAKVLNKIKKSYETIKVLF